MIGMGTVTHADFDLSTTAGQAPEALFGGERRLTAVVEAVEPESTISWHDPDLAVQELHAEYRQKIYSFALSMLRSREDAEDATQTTFMNAYNTLVAGQLPRQEASWLFRIARNVCLNRIRTSQRKPAQTIEGIEVAASRGIEDQVEQRLHARALRSALDRLPDQQRKAIVMRELQGASYLEIADALATTQGAVESLIFRARRQLATTIRASDVAMPVAA
jgi:RNA polymerase sigma factor (sigma-70 family)